MKFSTFLMLLKWNPISSDIQKLNLLLRQEKIDNLFYSLRRFSRPIVNCCWFYWPTSNLSVFNFGLICSTWSNTYRGFEKQDDTMSFSCKSRLLFWRGGWLITKVYPFKVFFGTFSEHFLRWVRYLFICDAYLTCSKLVCHFSSLPRGPILDHFSILFHSM